MGAPSMLGVLARRDAAPPAATREPGQTSSSGAGQPAQPLEPGHATMGFSGLLIGLAIAALVVPFTPALALNAAIGALLLVAGVAGLTVQAADPITAAFWPRAAWALATTTGGLALVIVAPQSDLAIRLLFGGVLAAQAAAVGAFTLQHQLHHDPGLFPLYVVSALTAVLGLLVLIAFPFAVSWLSGAIVAVALVSYAAALVVAAADARRAARA